MDSIFSIMTSWRVNVLILLGVASVLLIAGETDSVVTTILVKGAGFLGIAFAILLGAHWYKNGHLTELDHLQE